MARPRRDFRGARRQFQWVAGADQGYGAVATGGSTLLESFAPSDATLTKPTVVRVRGVVSVQPQAFSADVTIKGAWGIGVVSDSAFAIGITAVPKPFDDASWGGWLAWQGFHYVVEFIDGTGFVAPADREYTIDSKAMRKVGDEETIVIVAQSQAGAFDISSNLRMGFKLA